MAARKKVAKKKTPARKTSPARKSASSSKAGPTKQKAAPRKKPAAELKKPLATARPAAPKPAAAAAPPPPSPRGAISADAVLLGHVMGLRPRVHVGFKPSAFADAKRALAEERYATLEAAARAVAEKAIELSNEFSPGSPFSRR